MPEIERGQVWESSTGDRLRVQGFSKLDGWVMVREVGGKRRRASYPRTPFETGRFRLIEDAPDAR